ncbi:BspA family leucine-rich repeat surface protein [Prevotella copri]|uniref:BspA family leucine-rich repeat surface protein n=1 Tax=Segatella copri TaxID=165179 RepID=A0AAW5I9U4_9BACT|nr:BspA family leucine-rich repeat surface protein [Segatella copri]MCP9549222.1 BspA family leucine-rich repeat surface protein [Segatella copri]MCP9570066.1 BspA family leucine-rich repeat surface protein [Segatella copri]
MKHFSNQSNGSHVDRMNYGGAKFCRFALFPLMLLMLLLLPGRMVAQTEYDNTVTFTALEGNPEGYDKESYANLFDGKKEDGNFSKWCCEFSGSAYVILEASKVGIPVGYTITTGNDNANPRCGGRNPLSWKLYGNNEGKEGAWTLIDKVENDKVLQDKNYASYDFKCECSTSYQYFKWEISAIHSGSLLQVGEFELKLKTCTHLKADGSSALGAAIKTVEPTCTEHGYTTKECSLCHLIVKEYLNLKPHTLTHHALKAATCTEAGIIEYWQCNVCNKLFSNEAATTEITDAANLVIPANGHTLDSEGNCTVCGANRYALFNNLDGITDVTITDNGSYPWQMLDSNAEGMQDLGFTIPKGSNGLMSGNYRVDSSSSETVIRFKVSKTILLTSQVIISAEEIGGDEFGDAFSIYLDDKLNLKMRGKKQTEYKVLLSPGEHSLKLKYEKGYSSYGNADRAFLYNLKTPVTIDDYVADYESSNNTLTFKKITSNNIESLDLNHAVIVYNNRTVGDICYFLGIDDSDIKSVVFDKSFNTYAPTSLKSFFEFLTGLETIKDLKYLNTENVTDMSRMFWACYALTSLDLSNFNTTNVTNMREMFYNCKKLTSLDLSNFTTTNVTNMGGMFSSCSALTSLDLSNFYTKVVWWMDNMFNGCSALTTIYASDKFVTDYVHYGGNVFKGCTNLKGYDLSKTNYTYANCGTEGYFTPVFEYAEFDGGTGTLTFRHGLSKPEEAYALNLGESEPGWLTHNKEIKEVVFDASFANARPTGCYKWFYKCTNLATIEGFENLNTENMTKMSYMFFLCRNLSSLDLTNFNTGNVTEMWGMFEGCEGLTSLDLTSFNTANVTDMDAMFRGCSTLTTIYASEKFVTDQVHGYDMFSGCTSLKGYSNSMRDHNYANYKTGYFTKLVGKNGDEKIGATGETLTAENLALDDNKDFVAYEPFAAKAASYNRTMNAGTAWGTLCLPFAIAQSQETGCKFYSLTGIDNDNDCITLESYEEGAEIPAGTPVLFKINEGVPELEISAQNADLVIKPVAGTNKEVNLVGSFTKIGGKDNQGLTDTDYIIGKDKFWLVSELKKDGNSKGVGIKPMRAYIHPTTASQARAAMLSIGKGDGTTVIDNLNAISNDANAEYYDAIGRRTNGLQKGLNIVKRGSKTYKIMVK